MAQLKSPEAVIEATKSKLPPGVKLDRHGGAFRLRAYAGVSPATGKPEHLTERRPLDTQPRELVEAAIGLSARAVGIKAARRYRRREGGDAPLPSAAGRVERTAGQALDLWWKAHGQHLARAATHRVNIDCHLIPNVGSVALWRVRDAIDEDEAGRDPDLFDVGAFYARLRKSGAAGHMGKDGPRTGKGEGVGQATVDSVHATFRAALNFVAKKDGWLPNNSNPLAGMKVGQPAGGGGDTIPLEEEVAVLIPWLIEDRLDIAAAALLVGNGLRPTEVAAVRWQLIDLDAGVLSLRGEGVVRVNRSGEPERWELRDDPTDKRRARAVKLDLGLVFLLRRLWLAQRERALLCGQTLSRRAFVISEAPDGMTHMTPHSIGTAFTRALERARGDGRRRPGARTDLVGHSDADRGHGGLALPEGMTLYDMRHYGITHALRVRVSIAEVARRFGTSKRMINERYDHSVAGEDETAAAAMAQVWGVPTAPTIDAAIVLLRAAVGDGV